MKSLNLILFPIACFLFFSCKKDKEIDEAKCFCIEYKNQTCLKYYQTAGQDPWGSWLQSDEIIENKVEHFFDSLKITNFKISIKDTKNRNDMIYPCTCSKTGKVIFVKIKSNDSEKLKQFDFIKN